MLYLYAFNGSTEVGNTGNVDNTGNTGNTGNVDNTGNTGNTGNVDNTGNMGNIQVTCRVTDCITIVTL